MITHRILTILISLFGIMTFSTKQVVSSLTTTESAYTAMTGNSADNHTTIPTVVMTEAQCPVTTRPTDTFLATTRNKLDHPVEDAFAIQMPMLELVEYYTDADEFTIKDGELVRVLPDVSVYGNSKYVFASWRIIGPILLAVLLLNITVFCSLIIYKHHKDSEMNKCSTLLLVCIGIFDMLTIASAMTENIYLYNKIMGNYGALPIESCRPMYVLERLSPVPHTISIWLTLVLSIQRFICVSKPFEAKRVITLTKTVISVALVIILAVGFHIPRYFDLEFRFVALKSGEYPYKVIKTCDNFYKNWINNSKMYEASYLWTRFIIVKLVPCSVVAFISLAIFKNLRKNIEGRHDETKSRRESSSKRLSLYIAVVSLIIVVSELPIGVILCIHAVSISISTTIIPFKTLKRISFIADIVLYVSYSVIFLIYCIMTKKVRSYISNGIFRVKTCAFNRKTCGLEDVAKVAVNGHISIKSNQTSKTSNIVTSNNEKNTFPKD